MKKMRSLIIGSILLFGPGCRDEPAMDTSGGGGGEGGEPEMCAGVVAGDVRVSSDGELADLEGVGHVEGELRISGDVESLEALACLERVDGRLVIERTMLRDLSGLESLVEAESLVLMENRQLASTRGIGVQDLAGEIDELSGFSGSLSLIRGNHELSELRFDALREMGSMSIGGCGMPPGGDGNDLLEELDEAAFPVLESAVTLSVGSNHGLRTVDGMVSSFGGESPFMSVNFSDNRSLDGARLQELWVEAGLTGRLLTCGNGEGEDACECPPPP